MKKVIELTKETYDCIQNIAEKKLSVSDNETLVQNIETLKENERKKQERWDKKHGVVHLTLEENRQQLYSAAGIPIDEKDELSDELKKRKARIDLVLDAHEKGEKAYASLMEQYSNTIFQFYVRDNCGFAGFFNFIPQETTENRNGIAIINGVAIYKREMIMNDVKIDFKKDKIYYMPKKSEKYPLEVDNRNKDEWESFCARLLTITRDNKTLFDETMKKIYELDGEDYNPSKKNK